MTPRVKRLLAGAICTLIASSQPVAQDSGPVTRPLSGPNLTDRLPAPKPTASQDSYGRIVVSWAPIEGAVSYRLWRSVPPTPTAAVALPDPKQTSYVDPDVKSGSTYYYLVAAVNEAGIEGLRGATTPVAATMSGPPTPTVTAKLEQPNPFQVLVSFAVENARNYEIVRTMYRLSSTDPLQIDHSRPPETVQRVMANTSFTDSYFPIISSYARSVSYTVRANLWNGVVTPAGTSNALILPAGVGMTTGGTTSTTGGANTSSAAVAGSTTFTVAAPATVKNGATTSLSASSGSPARWVSLNESVATVDASGTVTGRSAGNTQIVALATSSDGSLRVVAITLSVTP